MADKEEKYTIYGSTTGIDAESMRPVGGIHQPEEFAEKMDLEPRMRDMLHGMNISYPIRTREEFASKVKADMPTACEVSGKKLPLGEMISILKDTDFPVRNETEAASLLASACPVSDKDQM